MSSRDHSALRLHQTKPKLKAGTVVACVLPCVAVIQGSEMRCVEEWTNDCASSCAHEVDAVGRGGFAFPRLGHEPKPTWSFPPTPMAISQESMLS